MTAGGGCRAFWLAAGAGQKRAGTTLFERCKRRSRYRIKNYLYGGLRVPVGVRHRRSMKDPHSEFALSLS